MELLSSSLPTTPAGDVRFESLVRACWGVPAEPVDIPGSHAHDCGGEDETISVVVTHADGSMSIERVSRRAAGVQPDSGGAPGGDDVLVSQAQAEKIRRHLFSRGVRAVHVHLLKQRPEATAHATRPGIGITTQEGLLGKNASTLSEAESSRSLRHNRRRPSPDEVEVARLGPSGDDKRNEGSGCFEEGNPGLGFDFGLRRWGRQSLLRKMYFERYQLA